VPTIADVTDLFVIPDRIAAGTTVKYSRTFADFPASAGWAMKVWLAGAIASGVDAVVDGDGFDVTLTATFTATLTPGNYRWVERVTKASEIYDAASGTLVVTPNLATATSGSVLSYEEKTLAVIESALTGSLTKGMESYQIDGIAVVKLDAEKLEKLRIKYQNAVNRMKNGGRLGRIHRATFPRV
jgi:hypothetical protein